MKLREFAEDGMTAELTFNAVCLRLVAADQVTGIQRQLSTHSSRSLHLQSGPP